MAMMEWISLSLCSIYVLLMLNCLTYADLFIQAGIHLFCGFHSWENFLLLMHDAFIVNYFEILNAIL